MAQQMMNAMRPDQPGGPAPENPLLRHRRHLPAGGGAADGQLRRAK